MDAELERQLNEQVDRGMEFYRAGDYEQAYPIFLAAAEQGLARAQRNCGVMYEQGQGVPADDAQALSWYEQAAAQDDARALYCYACMLRDGRGIEADPERATALYQRAMERAEETAAEGDPVEQAWCGSIFLKNEFRDRPDEQKALFWLEKAAEQGNAGAQFLCALIYYNGESAAADRDRASFWLEKAAEQGEAEAATLCGQLYRADGTEAGRAQSIRWLRRGAEQGSPLGQVLYGMALIVGDGVRADIAAGVAQIARIGGVPRFPGQEDGGQSTRETIAFWESMARKGDKLMQAMMALLCAGQKPGDFEQARYWCRQLKRQNARAGKLGLRLLRVTEARDQPNLRNGLRAIGLSKALAKLGIAEMQYQYGKLLDDMPLVHVQRKARKWYKKAARQGHGLAQYALACHYWSDGTRRSEKQCVQWLQKAAENGSSTAREDLRTRYHITL